MPPSYFSKVFLFRGGTMRHIEKIFLSLNETKSALLNQLEHLQSSSLSKINTEKILNKRKAILGIEVKLHKIQSQISKLKSKSK